VIESYKSLSYGSIIGGEDAEVSNLYYEDEMFGHTQAMMNNVSVQDIDFYNLGFADYIGGTIGELVNDFSQPNTGVITYSYLDCANVTNNGLMSKCAINCVNFANNQDLGFEDGYLSVSGILMVANILCSSNVRICAASINAYGYLFLTDYWWWFNSGTLVFGPDYTPYRLELNGIEPPSTYIENGIEMEFIVPSGYIFNAQSAQTAILGASLL
jgi:hypothetical protein